MSNGPKDLDEVLTWIARHDATHPLLQDKGDALWKTQYRWNKDSEKAVDESIARSEATMTAHTERIEQQFAEHVRHEYESMEALKSSQSKLTGVVEQAMTSFRAEPNVSRGKQMAQVGGTGGALYAIAELIRMLTG